MKKIGIITITDYNNLGNRLQNFAVQKCLFDLGLKAETIQNIGGVYDKNKFGILKFKIKNIIKNASPKLCHKRQRNFSMFNKYITISKIKVDTEHISNEL